MGDLRWMMTVVNVISVHTLLVELKLQLNVLIKSFLLAELFLALNLQTLQ
jgi:hypothetical protein